MRHQALLLLIALVAFGACSRGEEPPAAEEPEPVLPQLVVLISIDTLRADHLGLHGHTRFTSPVLDTFAAEGSTFTDASAPAPWTLPSHASMLTGRRPIEHGVVTPQDALAEGIPTLASMLEEAGFATAAVVNSTWLKQNTFGLTRDFDAYLAIDDADYGRRTPSTWVTDQATEWIRGMGDERLFVFVHYYDVHADYASMPAYEQLFVTPYEGPADGTGWQLQVANFDERHIRYCIESFDPAVCAFGSNVKPRVIDADLRPVRFEDDDVRHLEELYDAGIRQLDTELGRLFAFLDEQGLRDTALVIVTADHGEEFMDHGRVEHFLTTHQEMLHVPLIVRGPGVPAGRRIDTPVSLIDIVPTILSLVGAPAPDGIDGLDLSSLLAGEDASAFEQRPLYGEAAGGEGHPPPLDSIYPVYRSIRLGSFKLIRASTGEAASALYDLETDPGEQHDVSAREPERVARLEVLLDARFADFDEKGGQREAVELDPEERDRLRALGYLP